RVSDTRKQAHRLDATEDFGSVLWLDHANLDVGPRGDVCEPTGQISGYARQLAELMALELANGNTQPHHEPVCIRRQIKKPVPLEAKDIFALRRFAGLGMFEQKWVSIERMQLPFHTFLKNQIF